MKEWRYFWAFVLCCIMTGAQAQTNTNILCIPDITYPAGKTLSLPVELNNSNDIVGVQFEIDVPYEINKTGDDFNITLSKLRAPSHQMSVRDMGNQWYNVEGVGSINYRRYRIIIFNAENQKISGSQGELLNMELTLPNTLQNGVQLPINLVNDKTILSDRLGTNIKTNQTNGLLTIETIPRPDIVPKNVTVNKTLVNPGDNIDFTWTVDNIGDLATEAGWTEKLFLENEQGTRVLVGTTAFEGTLAVDASVDRTFTATLSDIPGISGNCRPVVQLIPAADCGEIPLQQGNNTAFTSGYHLRVGKQLLLTVNKNAIPENSTGGYYCELRRTGDTSESQTFKAVSSDKSGNTARVRFSDNGNITFGRNSNRVGFYVYAVDNEDINVDEMVAVIVNNDKNNGYETVIDSVRIEENDLIPLTFTTDKSDYTEGETIQLTVSVPQRYYPGQLAVYLNIEEKKRFKLPQRVVFEEGATSATINIPVIQDKNPANDLSIRLSGTAEHHTTGEVLFMLHDDDMPAIQMTLTPKTVSEAGGPQAIYGTITRSEVTDNKITIKLTDDGNNDIYYSVQTITMPAGTTTVNFPLGVRDNVTMDGDRLVHIRAAVYITDCNCSSIGDRQSVVTDSITITDDDGPTLTLTTSKPTILEGDETGCNLIISRNTDTANALTVTLESDATDVSFSNSVTIPAGRSSVEVPFKALGNDLEEGDRTVSVLARAPNFSTGSCWLLISDRTLPDGAFESIRLAKSEINMGEQVGLTLNVKNIGAAELPTGTAIKVWKNGTEWTSYTTSESIAKGATKTFTLTPPAIDVPGVYTISAVINPDAKLSELMTVNNTSESVSLNVTSLFSFTAQTDKNIYNEGDSVLITGSSTAINGTTSVHPAEIYVVYHDSRTAIPVTTDASGSFSAKYGIPAGYKGSFSVGACNPGENLSDALGSFEVYGLERAETNYVSHDLYKGEAKSYSIPLRNVTSVPLHNIRATFTGDTDNYDISVTPIATLPANGVAALEYTITGRYLTKGRNYEQIQFVLSSDEGATLSVNTWSYTTQRSAELVLSETNIRTNVSNTTPRNYPLILTNRGEGATGKISIDLPSGLGKLITLTTPAELPSMEQGDSTTVILRLNAEGLDVNLEQSGAFAINCENGNGVRVNFNLKTVSENKGTLRVRVRDEATIYGDKDGNKPYVAGATVNLKDYNTGANLQTGTSDTDGYATFEDISEGYYQVYVTAAKHDSYRQNVVVSPSTITDHMATISYQAVSMNWDVVETEVEDEYDIVTTVTFETQVPVPVIIMTLPDSIYLEEIGYGKSVMFNVVLRNEGLIAAQNTNLQLPEVEGFTFTPLVEFEGVVVGAQQSYVIPVRVTRNADSQSQQARRRASSSSGVPCSGSASANFEWPCGSDHKHAYIAKTVNFIRKHADGTSPCGGSGGSWGGSGGDGNGFGGMGGNGYQRLQFKEYRVNQGIIDMLCAISNFIPKIPGGDKIDDIDEYVDIATGGDSWTDKTKKVIKKLVKDNNPKKLLKDWVDDVTGDFQDAWNAGWGIGTVWNNVMNGKYDSPSGTRRSRRAANTPSVTSEPVHDAAYFAALYEDFPNNSYLRSYLMKMAPYTMHVSSFLDLDEQVLANAHEATLKQTEAFHQKVDDFTNLINSLESNPEQLVSLVNSNWNEPSTITDPLTGGALNVLSYCYNSSENFYDFSFRKYLRCWINTFHPEYSDGTETFNMEKMSEIINRIDSCRNDMIMKGFDSWESLYASANQDLLDFYENKGTGSCASVKLEIDQKLVMTRQAFRGTLTINNSLDDDLTDIELNVLVKDLLNKEATRHEFQINFESIEGFEGGVEGPWRLGPRATGTATILFIPTKYAAPDSLTTWSFGGTIYFTDADGVVQVRELMPVSLQVKPSPELDLTYFMQRDIYGDNPLTKDVIEPIVPAEFTVLIHNKGKGDATNIRMFTNQPKIIENEKGLLVDFNIISSQLNGGDLTLALDSTIATQFGDIPAGQSSYATWGLTSSLLGHFNSYDVKVNHVTSYGNPDLSLINKATIHELIHSVNIPNGEEKPLRGWAVNDGLTTSSSEYPDRLYKSDGTYEPIEAFVGQTVVRWIEGFKFRITIHAAHEKKEATSLWAYTNMTDPTMGNGGLIAARMMDPATGSWADVDLANFWQTQYTMIDGTDPLRDDKLHMVVPLANCPAGEAGQDYIFEVEFEPSPVNPLEVESIKTVPQGNDIATEVLDELTVTFSKPIDPTTFDRTDILLRYEGEKQTSDITITPASEDSTTYKLNMSDVSRNGFYVLQVKTDDILDNEHFTGKNGRQVSWLLFKGGLVPYNVAPWPSIQEGNVATSEDANSGSTNYGTTVSMTATPQEGYEFSYWGITDNNFDEVTAPTPSLARRRAAGTQIPESQIERFSDENPVNVEMNKVYNLRAVFKPKKFKITVDYDMAGGTFNLATGIYEYGTEFDLKAIVGEGYAYEGIVSKGELVTANTLHYRVTGNDEIKVNFRSLAPDRVVLRETVDYEPVAIDHANVTLQRTFQKGLWNTICVPCYIPDPETVFGEGTQVAQLTDYAGGKMSFTTVDEMLPNVPYIIKVGTIENNSDIVTKDSRLAVYRINGTSVETPASGVPGVTMSGVTFYGTYSDTTVPVNAGYYQFPGREIVHVTSSKDASIGRFRGYFNVGPGQPSAIYISVDGVDGIATDIELPVLLTVTDDVYDMKGQLVLRAGQPLNLPTGIYIMNGQKYFVKRK